MTISRDTKICLGSADGHVGAPTQVYKQYLEKALHPAFEEFLAHHVWRWAAQSSDTFTAKEFNLKMWDTEGFDPKIGSPVAWDSGFRLKVQDDAQVSTEVFFPDDQNYNDPPWGAGLAAGAVGGAQGGDVQHPSLMRAGAQAYNRWLAEFCSADPDRLRGITLVGTLEDPIAAAVEIRRAYDDGLRTGIMLPLDYDQPLLHHPRYDIVWETCQERNLSVITHVANGLPRWLGESPWVQRFMYVHEAVWFAQRPIWTMIMGGVLEKFPNLRLVITELGADWVPMLMGRLEWYTTYQPNMNAGLDLPNAGSPLTMSPSEYWQRQVYVAHTTSQKRSEFESPAYDYVPNMVWGIDIGHSEGWWPVLGWPEPVPGGTFEGAAADVYRRRHQADLGRS